MRISTEMMPETVERVWGRRSEGVEWYRYDYRVLYGRRLGREDG
jgi:hypothetical protein